MFEITLNPGFVPLLAALLALGLPRAARAPVMALSATIALWLLLDREFGLGAETEQMGIKVVPLSLDALNQVFGIALLIALIIISAYSSGRRNRFEDSAILTLAGGAVSALFVGDLILFVATAAISGLGAAWVVMASPREGAPRAGARLLVWHGIEGLLFLVGVALHLSVGGGAAKMARLDAGSLSDQFIFAALMIRVGAPLAHVWLKDVVSHASPAGASALTAFSTMLGVYALARMFPSEPMLVPIGAAMIVIGAFYAAAEDNLQSAAAYAQTAQTGVCLALIGFGAPLALASVEGHAFTIIFAFLALQMGLGNIVERRGAVRASDLAGIGASMPLSAAFVLVGGLAAAGAPGFALYPTITAALEAAAQWETRALWLLFAGLSAALFVALVLRPALRLHRPQHAPLKFAEAPYGMLLGASLAAFFCVALGLAPQWLYGLTPTEMSIDAYALDRVARQLQLLGGAGVVYLALRLARATAEERDASLRDLDALYRGPVVSAGRWAGVAALRTFAAMDSLLETAWAWLGKVAGQSLSTFDRPYAPLSGAAPLGVAVAMVVLAIFASQF